MLTSEQVIFRLVLAAVLGSIVGFDRQRLAWAAGLRTHMLVCLGAALFMIVSAYGFMDVLEHPHITLDPSRVAAQVVSGIGFLGAGTIIFRRDAIRGLTTAASLWTVAAVGLAVGGGLYLSALFTTLLIVVILAGIKPLERRFFQKQRPHSLQLIVERNTPLTDIESAIETSNARLKSILVQPGGAPQEHRIKIVLSRVRPEDMMSLIEKLSSLPGVRKVSYATD